MKNNKEEKPTLKTKSYFKVVVSEDSLLSPVQRKAIEQINASPQWTFYLERWLLGSNYIGMTLRLPLNPLEHVQDLMWNTKDFSKVPTWECVVKKQVIDILNRATEIHI